MTTENLTYTPGKWIAEDNGEDCWEVNSHLGNIATISYHRPDFKANAYLIAASKDLLEVAEAVMEWAQTPGDHGGNPYCKRFVKLAEAAIAKVEGGYE